MKETYTMCMIPTDVEKIEDLTFDFNSMREEMFEIESNDNKEYLWQLFELDTDTPLKSKLIELKTSLDNLLPLLK